jgi:hypothetical protein
MDSFTADDLRALRDNRHKLCVSFLMHTTPGGRYDDCLRWKGLLEEADRLLRIRAESGPSVKALIRPALDLLDDSQFWLEVSDGLAAFLAPGLFRTYRLSLALDDQVVVARRFHVKPLMPVLCGAAAD